MGVTIKIFGILLAMSWQWFYYPPKSDSHFHALYLGTLQLKYETEKQEAYLDVKVFSDDLQSAIRNAYDEFHPGPLTKLFSQNQPLIEAYFREHLQVKINTLAQTPTLYHSEQVNDTHLLQFKFSCPAAWNKLELTADFFMELFPNQINVISVSYEGKKQFARLSKQQAVCTTQFSN